MRTVPGHPAPVLHLGLSPSIVAAEAVKQITTQARTIAMTMTKNGAADAGLMRQIALAPSLAPN
jgi:hypothetical protein